MSTSAISDLRTSYTTETANEGKYWAQEYRAYGPGAMSGKPTQWKETRRVGFRTRRAAKARALKWYQAARAKAAA